MKVNQRLLPVKAHWFFFMAGRLNHFKTEYPRILTLFIYSVGANFALPYCLWETNWNFGSRHGEHNCGVAVWISHS